MQNGSVELGLGGLMVTIEKHFGERFARLFLAVVVAAILMFCLGLIWKVARPVAVLLYGLMPEWNGIEWAAPYGQAAFQVTLSALVVAIVWNLRSRMLSRLTAIEDALNDDNEALTPTGTIDEAAKTPPTPVTAADTVAIGTTDMATVKRTTPRPSHPERVEMADYYATRYLFPGRKRIVELRNTARTPKEQKESVDKLRGLFFDVSRELRGQFGASVEIRFVVGRPMARLGLSALDDFEAMWLELSQIVKEIRSGDLLPKGVS